MSRAFKSKYSAKGRCADDAVEVVQRPPNRVHIDVNRWKVEGNKSMPILSENSTVNRKKYRIAKPAFKQRL